MKFIAVVIVSAVLLRGQTSPDNIRLNQVRVLGSHNSYKQAIDPALFKVLQKQAGDRMQGLEYSHLPIPQQLDLGLRALEIDVVYDPAGSLYAHPIGTRSRSGFAV